MSSEELVLCRQDHQLGTVDVLLPSQIYCMARNIISCT